MATGQYVNLRVTNKMVLPINTNLATINGQSLIELRESVDIVIIGLTDGNKGDITVSGSGTVWTINNLAVTNAKILSVDATKVNQDTTHRFVTDAQITSWDAKESALTFSTGLTRAINTITANLSTGVAGSQSVIGGTAASETLTLSSTSHGTKGKILFGASAYDEVNNRLGIGQATPTSRLDITTNSLGVTQTDTSGILVINTTSAAAGAQQISPAIRWQGQGWRTTSPNTFAVNFRADVLPVQGSSAPTGNWQLAAAVGAGAYANKLTVKSDGLAVVVDTFGTSINGLGFIRADASNIGLYYSNQSNGYFNMTANGATLNYASNTKTDTSGTVTLFTSAYSIAPTSGTGVFTQISLSPTINQTGGANGITRSIYINPTLTAAADYKALEITNNSGSAIVVSGTAPSTFAGNVTAANQMSGTYTPTLTNTTNVTSSTPRQCTYSRTGNMVTVAGQFDIRATSLGVSTVLGISLPIASNFSTVYQAGGVASAISVASECAGIQANTSSDIAEVTYISVGSGTHTLTFTFSYEIL